MSPAQLLLQLLHLAVTALLPLQLQAQVSPSSCIADICLHLQLYILACYAKAAAALSLQQLLLLYISQDTAVVLCPEPYLAACTCCQLSMHHV